LVVSEVCAEFEITGLDSFADSAALRQRLTNWVSNRI
jgi:hypothetical protein